MSDPGAHHELEHAIESSDVDAVRAAISPAVVGARTASGQLLLFRAALRDDPAILDALLGVEHPQHHLDAVLIDIAGLHRAPHVRALLEHGADPNALLDDQVETSSSLWQCALGRESSPDVLSHLLDAGADPSARSEWGALPADSCSLALQVVFVERGLAPDPSLLPPPGYVGVWPWWAGDQLPDVTADYRFASHHLRPARRDRADFLIAAAVVGGPAGEHSVEQLWARRVDGRRFEVACVPFACRGITLGDVVETIAVDPCRYLATTVVEPSGHTTLAVSLSRSADPQVVVAAVEPFDVVIELVQALGVGHAIAIDVPDAATLDPLRATIEALGAADLEVSIHRSTAGSLDVAADRFRWDPP